jgi:hypothetical protein
MSEIPLRRNYTRVLIAVAILFAILFPLVPSSKGGVTQIIRTVMGTYGTSISAIIAPTLLYAGVRTKNWTDVSIGSLGTIPLCFWLAWIVYN